jgi:hypothetical protein
MIAIVDIKHFLEVILNNHVTVLSVVGCTLIFLVLMSSMALAAPIPPETARTAAGTFLSTQSPVAAKPAATAPSDLRDADGALLGYVVKTSSGGYVVTAADTDFPPILAYSDVGTFPPSSDSDNPAWHLVAGLVCDWRENLELAVPEASAAKDAHQNEWDRYLSGILPARKPSEEQTVWGPLLETQWGQLNPFNKYCPIDPNTGERSKVGCVPVQSAQILNYWKYPTSISLTEEDAYTSKQYGDQGLDYQTVISTIDIPGDSETLDFATFEELNALLTDITYSGDEDETAAFCFANAILTRTNLTSWASSAPTADYLKIGFDATLWIIGWPGPYDVAVYNMKNGWPVGMSISGYYTSGPNDGKSVGHSVVLDGFDAGSGMFHVNMGHAGDGDGWFLFPDMDANWAYFDSINQVTVNIVRGYGTLSGKITDVETGAGIPSVEVMVLPVGISVMTDADGVYEINLPPGTYSLELAHRFYKDAAHPTFDLVVDGQVTADATMEYDSPEISYWPFEESTEDVINGHTLGANLACMTWIDGPVGRAVKMHGTATKVYWLSASHADFMYRDNAEMTIETWVKIPDTSMSAPLIENYTYILSVRNGHILLWLHEKNPSKVMSGESFSWRTLEAPVDLKPEVWYHVAGVWCDKEYMKIYINGRLVAEQPSGDIFGMIPGHGSQGLGLRIGSFLTWGDGLALDEVRITSAEITPEDFIGYPFDLPDRGTLAGVITNNRTGAPIRGAIITCNPEGVSTATGVDGSFNMSLSAQSDCTVTVSAPAYHATKLENITITAGSEYLQNIYLNLRSDNPTVAWYRFDGNSEDSSGSGNDLSIVNQYGDGDGYEWFKEKEWVDGQSGSARNVMMKMNNYEYSITSDGFGCAYPGTGDWTVETWVKLPSENSFTEIVYHPGYYLGYMGTYQYPMNYMAFAFNGRMITAPHTFNADNWIHVAGVYRYLDRVELYINGELVAKEAAPEIPQAYPFAPLEIALNSTFYVIDDLRITAAALDPSEFLYATTAVEHDAEPLVFSLGANYPNPFNPTTTIPFTLAGDDFTTLVIYNLAGQRVRELVTGRMHAGAHTVVWDGRNDAGADVASGVYLSRLVAGESEQVRRMVLVK